MTLFDQSPLVNLSAETRYRYRAYIRWDQRLGSYTIGRSDYTGTGEVGTSHRVSTAFGPDSDVPNGHGFSSGTKTKYNEIAPGRPWAHGRVDVIFPSSPTVERVGVFYINTSYDNANIVLSTVKLSVSGRCNNSYKLKNKKTNKTKTKKQNKNKETKQNKQTNKPPTNKQTKQNCKPQLFKGLFRDISLIIPFSPKMIFLHQ